ncbi:hypothetical protein CsatB_030929 [Cannabis sativa]|uniref:Knottins-like domain-containing protein n=1 Tax=Cannabis sativa TaxID=3483 RepID=A0A7J6EKX9_CANSA|nr:hypothetical protein F8388_005217 [Cannabis sativa]
MESKKVRFGGGGGVLFFLLLLFVLLASKEVVVGVEGRVCESRSTHFLGKCMSDSGCTNSCRSQGFAGGACKGLRRRCFCSKLC